MFRSLFLILILSSFTSLASAQSPRVTLSASAVSTCDFARALGTNGQRDIRINLKVGNAYNYGEAYGQVFFDFRKGGKSQASADWFEGFRRTLIATGLFSENREYLFTVGAFANVPDASSGMLKRVELGKQILYHFRSGQGGTLELLTTAIQAGDRRFVTTTESEGLFPLTPRIEIIANTNIVQLEFEFFKSKQTQIETGLIGKIAGALGSVFGFAGGITFPQSQAVSSVIEGLTKPIQDVATAISQRFEPIESLKKIKSVGFLPGIAIDFNNVAVYSAEVVNGNQIENYDVRTYAAVIPSIISNNLDGDCNFPKYSDDPNSILRAAVTKNGTVEQIYKADSIRRTFLAQLGTQSTRADLVEACNSIKEDLRSYFGGFDTYAVFWSILASRENNFTDKVSARDCLTSSERKITYEKLRLPKLFGET